MFHGRGRCLPSFFFVRGGGGGKDGWHEVLAENHRHKPQAPTVSQRELMFQTREQVREL